MYFDRNATQSAAKRRGSGGMDRRSDAAWVSPQAVNTPRPDGAAGCADFSSDSIPAQTVSQPSPSRRDPWKRSLRLIGILLAIWFTASLGLGVLLAEPLNRIWIGGFPLGFWFAQQGSIVIFLVLLFVNAIAMDRIERDADRSDDGEESS